MILRDWLEQVDPIVDVEIWTPDDNEEPAFAGSALEIPWVYINYRLATKKEMEGEYPIFIGIHTNQYGVNREVIVINIREEAD